MLPPISLYCTSYLTCIEKKKSSHGLGGTNSSCTPGVTPNSRNGNTRQGRSYNSICYKGTPIQSLHRILYTGLDMTLCFDSYVELFSHRNIFLLNFCCLSVDNVITLSALGWNYLQAHFQVQFGLREPFNHCSCTSTCINCRSLKPVRITMDVCACTIHGTTHIP